MARYKKQNKYIKSIQKKSHHPSPKSKIKAKKPKKHPIMAKQTKKKMKTNQKKLSQLSKLPMHYLFGCIFHKAQWTRVKKATVWHPELLCFEKYGDKLNNEESGFHRVVYIWNTGKCIWLCRSVSVCNAALTPILTALWNDILIRKRGRKEKQARFFSPLFYKYDAVYRSMVLF